MKRKPELLELPTDEHGVVVPRGAAHSAEVIGDEPVVSLDAIRRS